MASSRWEHAREILAIQGIGGLLEELWSRLRHRLGDPRGKVPYHEFRTADWDRRRGVRTQGNLGRVSFEEGLPGRKYAESYIPVTIWIFRRVMVALLRAEVRPSEFTLVDYGCGKGRALLLAIESGFRAAAGVEFHPELAREAAENLRHYRGRRGVASVHHGNAADFPVPPGPVVCYLFNPFSGPVLEAVADNIGRSFAEDPRPMYIAYLNPRADSPFAGGAPFRLVESPPEYQIYRLEHEAAGPEEAR
jgi:hypothetical protein